MTRSSRRPLAPLPLALAAVLVGACAGAGCASEQQKSDALPDPVVHQPRRGHGATLPRSVAQYELQRLLALGMPRPSAIGGEKIEIQRITDQTFTIAWTGVSKPNEDGEGGGVTQRQQATYRFDEIDPRSFRISNKYYFVALNGRFGGSPPDASDGCLYYPTDDQVLNLIDVLAMLRPR